MHKYLALLFFVVVMALPGVAAAATLEFSPASASVGAGDTVNIAVVVSSADPVNAATGQLYFSADTLSIVSISHASSALTLWVQEPSFSNAAGTADFSGIVPNPGLVGSKRILTIQFRGKKEGTATIGFTSGQVLANDGNGTDVLKGTTQAHITITKAVPKPPTPKTPVAQAPSGEVGAPVITDFKDTMQAGEPTIIGGISDPGVLVTIYFVKDSQSVTATTTSDEGGVFKYLKPEGLREGIYTVQATAEQNGVVSQKSVPIFIQVIPLTASRTLRISIPLLYLFLGVGALVLVGLFTGVFKHRRRRRHKK